MQIIAASTPIPFPPLQSQTSACSFRFPFNKPCRPVPRPHPRPCYPGDRGTQMATAAQAPVSPAETDPVLRWLARRSACPQPDTRAAVSRANSTHSTGPRTESGKQRSPQDALRHGLTARAAVLATEDPEAYQRHLQQFLNDCAPANAIETQLVHEMANIAWRLSRIPFIEAELLYQAPRRAPLPPVPKGSRSAPQHPGRTSPPGAPPSQRSGRDPHTPSTQRTSL
jgi:hypothetical protein